MGTLFSPCLQEVWRYRWGRGWLLQTCLVPQRVTWASERGLGHPGKTWEVYKHELFLGATLTLEGGLDSQKGDNQSLFAAGTWKRLSEGAAPGSRGWTEPTLAANSLCFELYLGTQTAIELPSPTSCYCPAFNLT